MKVLLLTEGTCEEELVNYFISNKRWAMKDTDGSPIDYSQIIGGRSFHCRQISGDSRDSIIVRNQISLVIKPHERFVVYRIGDTLRDELRRSYPFDFIDYKICTKTELEVLLLLMVMAPEKALAVKDCKSMAKSLRLPGVKKKYDASRQWWKDNLPGLEDKLIEAMELYKHYGRNKHDEFYLADFIS